MPDFFKQWIEHLSASDAGKLLDWLQEQPAITVQRELREALLKVLGE